MRNSLAFAFLIALGASCFAPVLEKQCEKDLDCGSGWRCIAAQCEPGPKDGGTGGGGNGAGVGGGGNVGGGTAGSGGFGGGLCNPSSCSSGCCAGNVCIPPSGQNATNCGRSGAQCLSCAMGAQCSGGACVGSLCDSRTCPAGCCNNNICVQLSQQNQFQCGVGGGLCQTCGSTNTCTNGMCQTATVCNAQTCPNGCCSGNVCIPFANQNQTNCGAGGNACTACSGSNVCTAGVCQPSACNGGNCSGCCINGLCIPLGAQSNMSCGRGGAACSACPAGNTCNNGTCIASGCGPQTCMGCCINGMCSRGNDQFACGINGQACVTCPAGSTCLNGSCQGCGPATCPNGCCQFGFCQGGNISSACGTGGQACTSCPPGNTCSFQKCTPTSTATVGSPCTLDSECASIGMGAICKRFTSTGNAQYQGGYCTLRCGTGVTCPGGSSCASAPSAGENDSICLQNCGAAGQCRTPGYACYSFPTGGFNACWIFPTPTTTPDAGFRPDAGTGRAIGSACTDNFQCQPPSNAFCIPQSVGGVNTGYISGYCSRNCDATNPCGAGSVCITENLGGVVSTTCKTLCFNPGGGQGICRTGYICQPSPAGAGWCGPRCSNQSFPCPGGGTCNVATGYCQ